MFLLVEEAGENHRPSVEKLIIMSIKIGVKHMYGVQPNTED